MILLEKIILNRELGSNNEFDIAEYPYKDSLTGKIHYFPISHPFIYKLIHKHGEPSSLSHKGIHPNASELIDIFSRINEESEEIISYNDLGEFYYLLFDLSLITLKSEDEFFVDIYFETLEEKELKKEIEKPKAQPVETHTQAEESVEQQEQIVDQSNINHDHASGISGNSSSMLHDQE